MKILVAGIGNLLRGDDGVGSRVIECLNNKHILQGVEVLDAGTALWALLDEMLHYDVIIIVDAIEEEQGNVPGTITPRKPNLERERMPPHGTHELALGQMLALLHVRRRERSLTDPCVIVYGVEPETIAVGIGLTEAVEASIPTVAAMVAAECKRVLSE